MSHTIGQIKQNNQQSNNLSQVDRSFENLEEKGISPTSTLSDADYEFLFDQLLEGVAHGWHDRRIVKFFIRLRDRAEQGDWVAWLERLKDRALLLPPQSKIQLGTMMIRLGELTRSSDEVKQIAVTSHRIGRELLFGNIESVWEYVGPDLLPKGDYDATRSLTDPPKEELAERLPDNLNDLSFLRGKTAEESSQFTTEPVETESKLNSNEQKFNQELELSTPKSAISEKITADLVDFPKNIAETKQKVPNTIFSELELDLSSSKEERLFEEIEASLSNPNSISETNSDSDKLPDIAGSMHTEAEFETFDISQVMNLIQEDEELARQISQKLKGAISKPQNTVPQTDRSNLELIESWFNLGLKQVSMGEFTKAIASWEKALSINPNLSEAWHNRGSALGRLGDYQAAIESFQNALAIDPDNYQAWNDRAHALYQLQNWTEAADSWSNAIKIMPGNHLFWYNRGCALEQLQRWDEAIASHEKALEIVPNFQPGRSRYINLVADSSRSN